MSPALKMIKRPRERGAVFLPTILLFAIKKYTLQTIAYADNSSVSQKGQKKNIEENKNGGAPARF